MAADPKREFAVDVVRRLQGAGFRALWAGGCVRDLLLGKPPDDYDVATSARPDEVQTLFGPKRTLAIGASFGVILVHGPRRSPAGDVEVATFRTEGPYLDGRRPERVEFATAEEDARRRDFTINGMFYDPLSDQVFDYVGGQVDLTRKVVRAIGDPAARFGEDKLRMLRAVRIVARFDFTLDFQTASAVQAMAPEILVVSQERIAQELKKMLVHPRRTQALELAHELKLLTVILPELAPIVATAALPAPQNRWQPALRALRLLTDPRFELALAATFYDLAWEGTADEAANLAEHACRWLKLSNDECRDVRWLVEHRAALAGAPDWPLHRLKRLLAERLIAELLVLARAQDQAWDHALRDVEFCEEYLRTTPASEINPTPLITGDDLLAMGLVAGPRIREILERVRDAQLDGAVSTKDEALELARQLVGM